MRQIRNVAFLFLVAAGIFAWPSTGSAFNPCKGIYCNWDEPCGVQEGIQCECDSWPQGECRPAGLS